MVGPMSHNSIHRVNLVIEEFGERILVPAFGEIISDAIPYTEYQDFPEEVFTVNIPNTFHDDPPFWLEMLSKIAGDKVTTVLVNNITCTLILRKYSEIILQKLGYRVQHID